MAASARQGRAWGSVIIGLLLALIGLYFAAGGAYLVSLGGSAYYLIVGFATLVCAFLYLTGRRGGLPLFLLILVGTVVWSIWEVGFDFWQLFPRISGPLIVSVILILHDIARVQGMRRASVAIALALIAAVVGLIGLRSEPGTTGGAQAVDMASWVGKATEWHAYGNTLAGTRFTPAGQITPENVGALTLAWIYRTGDKQREGDLKPPNFQATPLKVGNTLYLCTGHSLIIALDAETGKEVWKFDPGVDSRMRILLNCRGVSYFKAPEGTADCPRRIVTLTVDARLIELDSETGKPCAGFGKDGVVDATYGLGKVGLGQFTPTSPPLVSHGVIVVNGFVMDGMTADVPGGVVRAFDALSGKPVWAWDPGAEDENRKLAEGETFVRDSVNSWAPLSTDEELGLVYVPTGNATPDYVDDHRDPKAQKYSTSIVALDIKTGTRRWNFQTLHNDLFDLDVPAQPVLFDWPKKDGTVVPALAQPTKQGYIYILDRRTGTPLTKVVEQSAPQGNVPGQTYSPTQPVQLGFPTMMPPPLTEADMWGATAFDQMLCRIRFHQLDYRGPYTPPSLEGTLQFPGNMGIMNWGGVSYDEKRGIIVANGMHLPLLVQLFPREEADKIAPGSAGHEGFAPQLGTMYGMNGRPFMSPLGVPCLAPPWGKIMGIDVKTRKVLWSRPLGSSASQAPLGIAVPGIFNIGGSVTTAGGVTFIGATLDGGFRAFDTTTGAELWRYELPAGGQATPMSYISDKSGRQFVVISAGGHGLMGSKIGDYVIAFALPKK